MRQKKNNHPLVTSHSLKISIKDWSIAVLNEWSQCQYVAIEGPTLLHSREQGYNTQGVIQLVCLCGLYDTFREGYRSGFLKNVYQKVISR